MDLESDGSSRMGCSTTVQGLAKTLFIAVWNCGLIIVAHELIIVVRVPFPAIGR